MQSELPPSLLPLESVLTDVPASELDSSVPDPLVDAVPVVSSVVASAVLVPAELVPAVLVPAVLELSALVVPALLIEPPMVSVPAESSPHATNEIDAMKASRRIDRAYQTRLMHDAGAREVEARPRGVTLHCSGPCRCYRLERTGEISFILRD